MTEKVLLTGGAGYIGSHTAYCLLDAGYEVFVLDDLSNSSRETVPAGALFTLGDVGDEALVKALIVENGIGAVIHFAGSIVVPESVEFPHAYYLNNVVKSHSLIGACLQSGLRRFVFSSSAAVYGAPERVPIAEDVPTLPINPYGHSKLMVEQMLRDVSASGALDHVALRYFNVAGADPLGRAGQRGKNATHLIKIAAETCVGRRSQITIFGDDYDTPDGTCVRDYIHVSDLAAAHLAALRYLEAGKGSTTLNCGYGRGYSVGEVLAAMERVTGRQLNKVIGPRRAGDPPMLVAATDCIHRELDWSPAHDDIDAIVQSAVAWEHKLAGR
jgi:UDP-glucose 4-epimerase